MYRRPPPLRKKSLLPIFFRGGSVCTQAIFARLLGVGEPHSKNSCNQEPIGLLVQRTKPLIEKTNSWKPCLAMSSIPRGVWKLDRVYHKSNLKCLPYVGKRPLRCSRVVLSRLFFRRSSRLQPSSENLWSGADSDHFTYKVWKIAAEFRILGFPDYPEMTLNSNSLYPV